MKYISFLFYLVFSFILISCSSDDIVNNNPVGTIFDIPIYQYNENSYLLDTSYGSAFEQYSLNGNSSININRVEVWVYCDPADSTGRRTVGFTNLSGRPTGGYDTSLVSDSTGFIRHGYFKKLNSSEFTFNPQAGYITIKNYTPIPPRDAIFAAYLVTGYGGTVQYGDFISDIPAGSILTLKMLRDRSEQSPRENTAYTQLWSLMLKNIYSIGVTNLVNDPGKLLYVRVVKTLPGVSDLNEYKGNASPFIWADGKNYMYLTGIDRKYNGNPVDTIRGGDGQFDFLPGATIDLETGSIIFPTLKPFSTTMINKGVVPDSLGANDSIYYNSIGRLTNGNFPIYFKIKGTVYN